MQQMMLDRPRAGRFGQKRKFSADSGARCLYRATATFKGNCVERQANPVNLRGAKDGAQVANERQLLGSRYIFNIVPTSPLRPHP